MLFTGVNMRKFLVFLLIFLGFFMMRMLYFQYLYFEEGAKLRGIERVRSYEKVILNHFPFSPYTHYAVDGVLKTCEELKENDEKLYCYETLRSSLIQIRSFYQPYQKILQEIEPHIAHLRTMAMINWKEDGFRENYARLYSANIKLLSYENTPSVFWSVVLVFSLLGWIGSVFLIIIKGFKTPLDKKQLLTGVVSFFLFFFLWLLSLYMA